nr:MAG TPA: hypothetical protein [Caudoviricetes sp.]
MVISPAECGDISINSLIAHFAGLQAKYLPAHLISINSRLTSGFFHTSVASPRRLSYDNRRPSTAH